MWISVFPESECKKINKYRVDTYEQKRNEGTDFQAAVPCGI